MADDAAPVRPAPALLLVAVVVVLASLLVPAHSAGAAATTRILPLGDSITLGYPTASGYRQALAGRLAGAGYQADFVGSQANGALGFADNQHEGHGGYRIEQLRAGAAGWVSAARPGVVLLMAGTNDFLGNYDTEDAPARMGVLIDTVILAAPTASVVVAAIPPISSEWCDCTARVADYNAAVKGLVAARAKLGEPVSFVDTSAVTLADLADGIHPDEAGYAKLAEAWAGAVLALPPSPRTPGPLPVLPRKGFWTVTAAGDVAAFGSAGFYGSLAGLALTRPIVGMAPTLTGRGYWLVASDGGIFAFGDAAFYGSTGALQLNKPIVGMAASPTGRGYWLVASDGGIFAFGDAGFFGSTGDLELAQPIGAMTASSTGNGYWFVAADGGVFAFGDARYAGSAAGSMAAPVMSMTATPTAGGYLVVSAAGELAGFGDAVVEAAAVTAAPVDVVGIQLVR
ncbi:MAG TPA: SGNH/GDSL hydrolase family protein [Acidimicrobiales bacterium]|nr:SGNH/GDSL hydrolase family protein [Acidimicrobiales bacterium]